MTVIHRSTILTEFEKQYLLDVIYLIKDFIMKDKKIKTHDDFLEQLKSLDIIYKCVNSNETVKLDLIEYEKFYNDNFNSVINFGDYGFVEQVLLPMLVLQIVSAIVHYVYSKEHKITKISHKFYLCLYLDKKMFYWLISHDHNWKLSLETTNAIYNELYSYNKDNIQLFIYQILEEYSYAIDLTVSEIFDKYEDRFESEGDIINYLEEVSSIVIDDVEYEIDMSFENYNGETTYILKPMNKEEF